MLNNKKIVFFAETVIDDVKVASYTASLNPDTGEMNIATRNIDNEKCKLYRDTVRTERAEFEDFAYDIQDRLA